MPFELYNCQRARITSLKNEKLRQSVGSFITITNNPRAIRIDHYWAAYARFSCALTAVLVWFATSGVRKVWISDFQYSLLWPHCVIGIILPKLRATVDKLQSIVSSLRCSKHVKSPHVLLHLTVRNGHLEFATHFNCAFLCPHGIKQTVASTNERNHWLEWIHPNWEECFIIVFHGNNSSSARSSPWSLPS